MRTPHAWPGIGARSARGGIPAQSVGTIKAINLSIPRNAKPQLGVGQREAKLGLGAPSMFALAFKAKRRLLNLMALTRRVGTMNNRKLASSMSMPFQDAAIWYNAGRLERPGDFRA